MSDTARNGRALPTALARRVDQACDRFEAGWKTGGLPRIEEYLGAAREPEYSALVRELILLDIYYRRRTGEFPSSADYLGRFPGIAPAWLADALAERADAGAGGSFPSSCHLAGETQVIASTAPLLAVGQSFADYELLEELGRGGMGVVYQARQKSLNRLVALKTILAGAHAGQGEVARFLAEADVVARLQHPNIVHIHETGRQSGLVYLSLEYVSGGSLARRLLQAMPLPPREAAALLEKLARAVHYAHQRGIVHRDLKPANVLLTEDGTPKITDFGLAKAERPELTTTGAILGTPAYMAPEQAAGDNRAVGPAADTYALGAILYEMLTGRPPFRGATVLETLEQVTTQEPVPPTQLRVRTPRDLSTICLKCLQKEPGRRYGNAAELAEDLRRFQAGEPIRARPVGTLERAWRWSRRNPVLASLSTLVVLLLVFVAVGSSLMNWRLGTTVREVAAAKEETTGRLWQALVEQARARRLSRQPGQRFLSLEALDQAAALRREPGLRNDYLACFALSDLRRVQEWDGSPTGTNCYVFDGLLERYARSDWQGRVSIRDLATDTELAHLDGFNAPTWLRFSADGRRLAVWSNPEHSPGGHLQVWEVTALSAVQRLFEVNGVSPNSVEFAPDAQLLALRHVSGVLRVYAVPSGRLCRQFEIATVGMPAFHPHAPLLACSADDAVQLFDLAAGTRQCCISQEEPPEALAWDPVGNLLAVASRSGRIHLWDVPAAREVRVLPGHRGGHVELAFSHRGDLLASQGEDGVLRLWSPFSGALLATGPWITPGFSPDDRRLAASSHGTHICIWETHISRDYRTLAPSRGRLRCSGAIHPTGRLLAVALSDGVGLWDLTRERELSILPGKDVRAVLFEPSGSLLASTADGLFRWRVQGDAQSPAMPHFGPPEVLSGFDPGEGLASSADGRVVACAQGWGALVRHADRPGELVRLSPHEQAHFVAVSSNGRWVATGTYEGAQVKVWDARTGKLATALPLGSAARLVFSPDGRWLATDCAGRRLWAVDTWQERVLPAAEPFYRLAFSPDGRLLAGETYKGVVCLTDPESGHEYARLEDPNQDHAQWSAFVPDGTKLVTLCTDSQAIHIWDLRSLRRQLAERGLDWDLPDYPPLDAGAVPP